MQIIGIDPAAFCQTTPTLISDTLNLLPCRIKFDGKADVSKFLVEEKTPDPLIKKTV
jgi:hypothetical protein